MLVMNEDLEGALKSYLRLLNEGAYFDAHEVLEEAWHPLRLKKDTLANLLKGFINAAIAFEHIKRNRKNVHVKAQKVIASYERYKGLILPEIRCYALFIQAEQKIEVLKKQNSEIF